MELTDSLVSNQGERVLPGDRAELVSQHEARYLLAQKWIAPSHIVLDCACGSGYGLPFLAERAKQLIAVDISPVALAYAEKHFAAPNIRFELGSAEALNLPSGTVDVFCSFETIEHIPHPEKLVSEARRLLRRDGIFLVSTPNRVVSGLASGEKPGNPFHLIEWSLKEFDATLRRSFSRIDYFGQRVRSRNKFSPKYVSSKVRRAVGLPDFVAIPADPRAMDRMETWQSWQPENFIAVCRVG
jgi:SAM-dependent methyltransferase